jgi:hypothetical protein
MNRLEKSGRPRLRSKHLVLKLNDLAERYRELQRLRKQVEELEKARSTADEKRRE